MKKKSAKDLSISSGSEDHLSIETILLRESESILKIGSWIFDVKTQMQTWTQGMFEILEITSSKKDDGWLAYIDQEFQPVASLAYKNALELGEPFQQEWKIITSKATIRWVRTLGKAHFVNGKVISIHGSFQDITEYKLKEDKSTEMNKYFISFLENTPDIVYFKNADNRIVFCSQSLAKITGHLSWRDMTGKNDFNVFPKEMALKYSENEKQLLNEGIPLQEKEEIFYDLNGNINWTSTNKWPLQDEKGKLIGLFGISRNITEQKIISTDLKNTNLRFTELLESTEGVIWEADAITFQFRYISKNAERIFGYLSEEWLAPGFWISKIHKEDCQTAKEFCIDQTKQCVDHEFEYRFITKDGSIKWVSDNVKVIHENGKPVLLRGLMLDITERKKAEAKLIQLTQAIEQSPASIMITDTNGNIEYVNTKYIESTGYSFEEVIGKKPSILKSGYTTDKEYAQLWQSITVGKEWQGVLFNKKKNGELYWQAVKISAIKNNKGVNSHFLVIKLDITEQKKHEAQLQRIAWHQSHLIRGPLTTILGIINAMKLKISLEDKLFFLQELDNSAKELDTAIHSIVAETIPKIN